MNRLLQFARTCLAGACLLSTAVVGCHSPGDQTAPATDTVTISGMTFHPAELHIRKGDTVVWINNDIVSHDVTERPGKAWTSDTIATGNSWKKAISQNTDYFCSIHPTMEAKIIVRE